MKNITIALLFLIPSFCFSQQFLWSTTKVNKLENNDVELIAISEVTEKVLDYYDFYEYYHDLSGFSIEGFKEFLKKDLTAAKLIQWDLTMLPDEPSAFAFKGNNGRGSMVIVMFIQKENIDLILFTNEYRREAIITHSSETDKFEKWLSSFWDHTDKNSVDKNDPLLPSSEVEHGLANRHYIVRPTITDVGTISGRVAVEVRVNREGKIVSVRTGAKGTTIMNSALNLKIECALKESLFNPQNDAPEIQTGIILFDFKMR